MMRLQFAFIALAFLTVSMVVADDDLHESKAIEKIELLGGKVTRDEKLPGRPVVAVDLQGSIRFNDNFMRHLKSFSRLSSLNLQQTRITDAGLKELGDLNNLTKLNLNGTKITDAGTKEISQLKSLNDLEIADTAITDDGLKELCKLDNLGRRKGDKSNI